MGGRRNFSARRRFADQSVERNARRVDLRNLEKSGIDRDKRVEQRRVGSLSGLRRECRHATENTDQPETKCLLSQSNAGRGSHANE